MSSFKNILLDFDGTIMDTSEGILNSFEYTARYYSFDTDREKFRTLIGPPLKDSFRDFFHFKEDEIPSAMAKYREYYTDKGMFQVTLYDGIREAITELKNLGCKVFVATSKPEIYARSIIQKCGLSELFDFVGGSDTAEITRVRKEDVIKYVLNENSITCTNSCLMAGDRNYDIEGAHSAGIKCAAVLYGFGSRQEFEQAGADYIIAHPKELVKIVKESFQN